MRHDITSRKKEEKKGKGSSGVVSYAFHDIYLWCLPDIDIIYFDTDENPLVKQKMISTSVTQKSLRNERQYFILTSRRSKDDI